MDMASSFQFPVASCKRIGIQADKSRFQRNQSLGAGFMQRETALYIALTTEEDPGVFLCLALHSYFSIAPSL